jgi:phosphoenolpyruvate-protein kinase (PTS system EI component)
MSILANAETAADVATALDLGAEGFGLFRTEHMFFR